METEANPVVQADVESKGNTPRIMSLRKVNSFRMNLVSALTGKLSTSSRRIRKEKSNLINSTRFQEQDIASSRTLSAEQSGGSKNEEEKVDEQDLLAAEATGALLNAAKVGSTETKDAPAATHINPADLTVTEDLQTRLVARFSFHGKPDANELNVHAGAALTGVSKNNLWWVAVDDSTQAVGYIPTNYVDEL